jgi:predicted dehydrogenase
MNAPLRGALIGFGSVAEHGHLPAWLARDDMHLVAVVEPDPARQVRGRALLPDATFHRDVRDLFANVALDFVDIATPPALHTQLIAAAALAGVHIVCEKPLAVSLEEHRRACDAVTRAGVTLFTVDNWKYSEPFRRVRTLVDDDAIGPLTAVRFEVTRDGCARSATDGWRTRRELAGGGILVDHGWHAFYLMLELVKERPSAIRVQLAQRRYVDADVEDSAQCTIEFPSVIGRLDLTWAGHERRTRWQLQGRDGDIDVTEDRVLVRRAGRTESFICAESLSASSHHPEWFGGVIDAFRREILEPAVRGENLAQAEQCVQLLSMAYSRQADGAPPPPRPTADRCFVPSGRP